MDAAAARWTARDAKQLPFKQWGVTAEAPRAVIICVHGLSGAASDFRSAGESLPAQGFHVYGLQLRGQGNDPDVRRRGDIGSSTQWRHDLIDFTRLVRQRHPGAPVFWFGESLGALICLDAAARAEAAEAPAGVILASPVVELRRHLRLPFFEHLLVHTLFRLVPGKRVSLESMPGPDIQVTSTTTHAEQMQRTPHHVKDFAIRLIIQVEKLIKQSRAMAASLRVPVLILYTPHDALTPRESVERFFAQIASADKTRVFFPHSYHLILHDRDRAAALRHISEWLRARTRQQ